MNMSISIAYTLVGKEYAAACEFMKIHEIKHGPDRAAAGGRYGWHIYPCGIGTAIHIVCNQCKEIKDISDYEW